MTSRSYIHGGSYRIVVGISSRSSERDLQWLMDFIKRSFSDHVSYVKYLPISNTNRIEWERNVRACSHGILYHTKRQGRINIADVDGALYNEELQILFTALGRSNVLVVLDDLENCSDTEKQRILESLPSLQRLSSDLLLFPEEAKYEEATKRKEEFIKLLGINSAARNPPPNTTKAKDASGYSLAAVISWLSRDKISKISSDCKTKYPSINIASVLPQPRLKIGIFSRSAESNYGWLVEWLKTTYQTRPVDVRPIYISNTATHFYTELTHCSFAILYHTKKQGRINITDVTDNLYDDELQELSNTLGKENVIVVIDDLQKTDASEKDRILRNQPSIGRLARGLFLFNEKKREMENLEEIEQILRKKIQSNEVRGDDGQEANAEKKNQESRKQTWSSDSARSQVSSADHEPSSSCNNLTEGGRKLDMSTLHDTTRKGADDSRGTEAKRRNLDPMGPTLHSSQAYAAIQEAITMIQIKCQEYEKIKEEESRDEIRRLQRENEELQSKNSDLDMKMRENEEIQNQLLEAYNKTLKEKEEKERTMDQLRQDLRHKDKTMDQLRQDLLLKDTTMDQLRQDLLLKDTTMDQLCQDLLHNDGIIAENQETIWKMEDKIKELRKTLSEKKLEIQSRNQTERNMEKLRQDLRHKDKTMDQLQEDLRLKDKTMDQLQEDLRLKDKTIAEDKEKIRKMEEKMQQLLNTNQAMETKPRQEHAGQNWKQYQGRSPIHGQEDSETNEIEMYNRDMKNGDRKKEGFLLDRTQSNSAMYNLGHEPIII